MTQLLPSLVLVPALLAPAGTRERVEILERDVASLQQELVQIRQDQTKVLLELEKLNQRLGVAQERGMADVEVRMEGMNDDVRVLFENLNDMDSRMRRLEERLDLAMESMYRRPGSGAIGAVRPGVRPAGPTTPPMEEYPGESGVGDGQTGERAPLPGSEAEAELLAGQEGAEGTGMMPGGPTDAGEPSLTPPGVAAASGAGEPPPPAGTDPAATPATGQPMVPVDPEELYQTAYTDFARGNYELAILGFQDYVKRFPDTDHADNAQYWIGESHYSLGRYRQAVQAFQDVEILYPGADKVPDAMLKKGYALIEMNLIDDGIRQLQKLISDHPRSNAARIGRQRLRSMGLSAP